MPAATKKNARTTPTAKVDDPRTMRAWAFYDWANSSYALVINTALFPLYFQSVMSDAPQVLNLFGYEISANAAYSYSLSLSFLILVLLSPVLSSIAGSRGNKLSFLKFFCTLGALSCMGLFFFKSADQVLWALLFNITASIGFYGSLVFYNAYLPEIASPAQQDMLSARGFSLGYVGSLLILIISLVLIQVVADESNRGFYTRLCFFLTGCWWLGFAQYSFARLPKNRAITRHEQRERALARQSYFDLFTDSFEELQHTVRDLVKSKQIKWFLTSFFFYSVGMQTIFLIATFIGTELNLSQSKMIITIMLLQVVAIIGATLFSWLSKRIGNIWVLMSGVSIWIIVCLLIYTLSAQDSDGQNRFFGIAGLVGLVMGGLQSMSRSTYSKLLPTSHDSATFFSFYDILEKIAIIVGTGVHGYLINKTGTTHASSLALAAFFVVGLICLSRLKVHERRALSKPR